MGNRCTRRFVPKSRSYRSPPPHAPSRKGRPRPRRSRQGRLRGKQGNWGSSALRLRGASAKGGVGRVDGLMGISITREFVIPPRSAGLWFSEGLAGRASRYRAADRTGANHVGYIDQTGSSHRPQFLSANLNRYRCSRAIFTWPADIVVEGSMRCVSKSGRSCSGLILRFRISEGWPGSDAGSGNGATSTGRGVHHPSSVETAFPFGDGWSGRYPRQRWYIDTPADVW